MIGTEPPDREPAEYAGPGYRDRLAYNDKLGVVSEGRPMSRPGLIAAVVAVCGTGLLAGLGLFGGSAPKPPPAAPAAAVVKVADTAGARTGEHAHEHLVHRLHSHHLAKQGLHGQHAPGRHVPAHRTV